MKSCRKSPPRKSRKKPSLEKHFRLVARGWAVEVTAHRLTQAQCDQVSRWCLENSASASTLGNMEGVVDGYNCYWTNLWQSGCVPLASQVSFVLIDAEGSEVFSVKVPLRNPSRSAMGPRRERGVSPPLIAPRGDGSTLVYFEESKGLVAVWPLVTDRPPAPSDLSFRVAKIVVDGDTTEYVESVLFGGADLEREYDAESLEGKAAYSVLL